MATNDLRKKFGAVLVIDALGASNYTEVQIKKFLSARAKINEIVKELAKKVHASGNLPPPSIFTFGDTIIVTIELRAKKHFEMPLFRIWVLLRRYLYHSLENGILFRGVFSIGHYIEDQKSNTVMGPAVSDAASWYTLPEWMGISSTPKTNNYLESYYHSRDGYGDIAYLHKYPVPLKQGNYFDLYTIDWPSAFFDKGLNKHDNPKEPRKRFLELLKELQVPLGTEMKYENTKKYFTFIEKQKLEET